MSYGGLVCRIKVRPHENADNLAVGNCSGYQVVVSKDTPDDAVGLFFQADTQLGERFCLENKLYKKHPLTGEPMGGYLEDNRRVRTIKLRGVTSDGLWLPISCLDFGAPGYGKNLKLGEEINDILLFGGTAGIRIAQKYETPATRQAREQSQKKGKKQKLPKFPTFHKHYDTPQLMKNLKRIPIGAQIIITEKLHGTSGRSGYLQCIPPRTWLQRFLRRPSIPIYKHVLGTRNTIVHDRTEEIKKYNPLYQAEDYRTYHHRKLALRKGETIYYEIVGYTDTGATIMPSYSIKDKETKELREKLGTDIVRFIYGQEPGTSEIYVYRITYTNEDGYSVEMPWWHVKRRCQELGVKTVPELAQWTVFEQGGYDVGRHIADSCKALSNGPSILDSQTIKEGVCVRVEHPEYDGVLKYKSWWFCHLEGIAKQDDSYVDLEDIS